MSQFYYVDDEKITLQPSSDFVAIKTQSESEVSSMRATVDTQEDLGSGGTAQYIDHLNIMLVPTSDKTDTPSKASNAAAALAQNTTSGVALQVFSGSRRRQR